MPEASGNTIVGSQRLVDKQIPSRDLVRLYYQVLVTDRPQKQGFVWAGLSDPENPNYVQISAAQPVWGSGVLIYVPAPRPYSNWLFSAWAEWNDPGALWVIQY